MSKYFSLKYYPYFVWFSIIWGMAHALNIQLPYFIISIPNILAGVYIIVVTSSYYTKNRVLLWRERKFITLLFLLVVCYAVFTLIKISIYGTEFDFWRQIFYVIGSMFCVGIALFSDNPEIQKTMHHTVLRYFPYYFIFICIPFMHLGASLMTPMVYYVSLFMFLPKKRYWLAIFAVLFVLLMPGQRFPLLQMGFAGLFYALFYYRLLKTKIGTLLLSFIFLLFPIVSLYTSVQGIFNPFEYMEEQSAGEKYGDEDLSADTRSFLYEEALLSVKNNGDALLGRTFGYGYDSEFAYNRSKETNLKVRKQRVSEVFMINVFIWMGGLGVVLIFIVFVTTIIISIVYSNNIYSQYLGLLLSVQWVLLWIEMPHIMITNNIIVLWSMMSLCVSPYWRRLTNHEFAKEMKAIFNYKK